MLGITCSDDPGGYLAHEPVNRDNGTISPTAALSSWPYTPTYSMDALKYFYFKEGENFRVSMAFMMLLIRVKTGMQAAIWP